MAGFGYDAVMEMAWTDARDFALSVAEERRMRWLEQAWAVRVGGADQKSWEKITRDLT
jgi:hypothetical protein